MEEHDFVNGGSFSSVTSSISPSLQVQVDEEEEHNGERRSDSYRVSFTISDWSSSQKMDEAWSYLILLVLFWFFSLSMTMLIGFYPSEDLRVGKHCSLLLKANPFFVNKIQVKEVSNPKNGPVLYGFYSPPSLDVETNWSDSYEVSVPANSHKEWDYYLNQGSELDIMYRVKNPYSSALYLIVSQDKENIAEWVEDSSHPNITSSWNVIHGSGRIQQKISKSSEYYIAVGNMNPEEVEVQLKLSIRASSYNTTNAYYKCSLSNGQCSLKLHILRSNVAVLSFPGPEPGTTPDDWLFKISYQPRWIVYFVASGAMTFLFFLIYIICTMMHSTSGDDRTPLLTHKDDEILSLGSSYGSLSHDEEDLKNSLIADSTEAKHENEIERKNPPHICTICFDSPRDCFFLPCGHSATCFTCGERIIEDDGVCPICLRKMKKLRKIFAV